MAETAAVLADCVLPRVPVRQWVLSFPIPLRILLAAHPELLIPVLRIVHRVIASFLLSQAGLKRTDADAGAVTLIQRFGSTANLNVHLHCLVLDGAYRRTEGELILDAARAPSGAELAGLLDQTVARLINMLTRASHLVEEQGMIYLAVTDADHPLSMLQAASCTYRIALGPRAGQKVLSLRTGDSRDEKIARGLCADAPASACTLRCGFGADQRKQLEQLYRYIAHERLSRNAKGQVVLKLKSPYRDGTIHIVMHPQEFMQSLAALVPRRRLHLIRFHGVLAPNARLRAVIIPQLAQKDSAPEHAHGQAARMSWAGCSSVCSTTTSSAVRAVAS